MPTSGIVTATPKNAIGAPIAGKTITFATSNASVATVLQISPNSARVTGVGAGSADITAECDGVTSNVCAVTVA